MERDVPGDRVTLRVNITADVRKAQMFYSELNQRALNSAVEVID